jgi:CRP/FNR family transcriptional regulator, cyclic AMP receptor protein
LSDKSLDRIGQQMKRYAFGPGASVIEADTSGKFGRLYTIIAGTAEARIHDEVVASYGPGDYFGEMSLLDGSPRSAEVVATSDLTTMALSGWNMRALLREEPEISVHIIESLVARLRATNEALRD